jgi:hypothetical protein
MLPDAAFFQAAKPAERVYKGEPVDSSTGVWSQDRMKKSAIEGSGYKRARLSRWIHPPVFGRKIE